MTVITTAPSISTIVDRLLDQCAAAHEFALMDGAIKPGAFRQMVARTKWLKSNGWYGGDYLLFRHSLAMAITDCPDSSLAERLLAIHSTLLDWERAWADNNN